MTQFSSKGIVRKFVTRVLAAGTLLAIYAVGTVATTGVMITAGTTPAMAGRRGRRGRGRGVGTAVGVGIGLGLLGAAAAAAAEQERRREIQAEQCFETGYFIGDDGRRYRCRRR
jgi:hypothetical protein